jgi:hypothetical protein
MRNARWYVMFQYKDRHRMLEFMARLCGLSQIGGISIAAKCGKHGGMIECRYKAPSATADSQLFWWMTCMESIVTTHICDIAKLHGMKMWTTQDPAKAQLWAVHFAEMKEVVGTWPTIKKKGR